MTKNYFFFQVFYLQKFINLIITSCLKFIKDHSENILKQLLRTEGGDKF